MRRASHDAVTTSITPPEPHLELATAFALARGVAAAVTSAVNASRLPIVIAGNCNVCMGIVAGLARPAVTVVWLDAHGDLNTPETTTSGFLDGMALATLTGRCWQRLSASVPGFRPVPDRRVVLVGARDLDPAERTVLEESEILSLPALDVVARPGATAFPAMRGGGGHYLHVDLDVLDTTIGRANSYARPGGLSVDDVCGVIDTLRAAGDRLALALTAYDPDCDPEGSILDAATRIATYWARR